MRGAVMITTVRVLILSLVLATPAWGTCAWVLWVRFTIAAKPPVTDDYQPQRAYATLAECEAERAQRIQFELARPVGPGVERGVGRDGAVYITNQLGVATLT